MAGLQCVLKGQRTTASKGAQSIQDIAPHQSFVLHGDHQNSTHWSQNESGRGKPGVLIMLHAFFQGEGEMIQRLVNHPNTKTTGHFLK